MRGGRSLRSIAAEFASDGVTYDSLKRHVRNHVARPAPQIAVARTDDETDAEWYRAVAEQTGLDVEELSRHGDGVPHPDGCAYCDALAARESLWFQLRAEGR